MMVSRVATLSSRFYTLTPSVKSLVPTLYRLSVSTRLNGNAPPGSLDDDVMPLPVIRKPKRKWMSVTDLVTEVEKAMKGGISMDSSSTTYHTLQEEANRLRLDNDALLVEIDKLKLTRAEYVILEDQISSKLNEDKFALQYGELVQVTKKIQDVDSALAALRYQHLQNVRDVGTLKKAMSKVTTRGEVSALIAKIEEAWDKGEVLSKDSPEASAVSQLIDRLQNELSKASAKSATYSRNIADLQAMSSSEQQEHGQTPENAQMALVPRLKQSKRMIAQLTRLDDIQVLNAHQIGRLQRIKITLIRNETFRALIANGDVKQMKAATTNLQEDTNRLRNAIKEIESGLDANEQDAISITAKLRSMKDVLTPTTGKLREDLVAKLHQEEQWKVRLAVLRGETIQNMRFLAMLSTALSQQASSA